MKISYERNGFISPIRILNTDETLLHRHSLEDAETQIGPLHYKFKVHTILRSPYELVTHPVMLDTVEDLLGPNILIYNVVYIIKEPHTLNHFSWHQDLTYGGFSSDQQVSAYLALSPATASSGCMHMIPGSHKEGQLKHVGTQDPTNILLDGQTVEDVDEDDVILCELQPGEASFHHGWTLHASKPNQSDDRRIGLTVQYIATDVRQTLHDADGAMLVRGEDQYHHFQEEIPAASDLNPQALKRREILEHRMNEVYEQGMGKKL